MHAEACTLFTFKFFLSYSHEPAFSFRSYFQLTEASGFFASLFPFAHQFLSKIFTLSSERFVNLALPLRLSQELLYSFLSLFFASVPAVWPTIDDFNLEEKICKGVFEFFSKFCIQPQNQN